MGLLKGIGKERWTAMWERLKQVDKYFEYQYPSERDDAVQMIWQALARKVPAIRLKVNRLRRYQKFGRALREGGGDGNFPVIDGF